MLVGSEGRQALKKTKRTTMDILTRTISLVLRKRLKEIERFGDEADQIQDKQLRMLLDKAKGTLWGQAYDYKSIRTYADYRERVPIQTYDDLKPYINRMRLRHGDHLLAQPARQPLLRGERVDPRWEPQPLAAQPTGPPGRPLRDPDPEHPGLGRHGQGPEEKDKIKAIVESTWNRNVSNLSGVPSWMLVLLKAILARAGKTNLAEVWPNLEVFFHGGISFEPYRDLYKSLIDSPKMRYMETYNASEGFFGLQDDPDEHTLLLMLDYGIFYEFIPMSEISDEHPKAIPLTSTPRRSP